MNIQNNYESPAMEVLYVLVEQGFAGSDDGNQLPSWDII